MLIPVHSRTGNKAGPVDRKRESLAAGLRAIRHQGLVNKWNRILSDDSGTDCEDAQENKAQITHGSISTTKTHPDLLRMQGMAQPKKLVTHRYRCQRGNRD